MSQTYAPPRDPTEVLGRRFAALAIDLFFLAVIGVIVLATAKHHSYYDAPSDACAALRGRGSSICAQFGDHVYVWERSVYLRSLLLGGLAAFLDLVVLQTLTGGSVGKLCVGLRVIEVQGNEARFLRMFGRWLFLLVDLGVFVVGLVTTLATHPHRRVGDLVCGTYVVGVLSVGHPVIVELEGAPVWVPPPSGYGAPPGAPVPPGWGAPTSWSTGTPPIPVPTPPGTAPTTPGEWGAVAWPGPALVRSPAWEAPPPTEAAVPATPRGTTAPQWATPPVPKADDANATDGDADDGEATDAGASDAAPEEISPPMAAVGQWSPVVPLADASPSETTSGPSEAPASPWRPVVPVSSDGPTPVREPTPPAPPPPAEPVPPPPTEPAPPPPAAAVEPEPEPDPAPEVEPDPDDDQPWWDVAPSRNDR